jgi:hypothetical protein
LNNSLQQMGPLLNNLVQASNEYGFALDSNTQDLIAQAEAAGVAFRVEPMQQVADTLVVIAQLLGATEEQLAGLGSTAANTGTAIREGLSPEMSLGPFNEGLGQTGENLRGTFGSDATAGLEAGLQRANAELGVVDENLAVRERGNRGGFCRDLGIGSRGTRTGRRQIRDRDQRGGRNDVGGHSFGFYRSESRNSKRFIRDRGNDRSRDHRGGWKGRERGSRNSRGGTGGGGGYGSDRIQRRRRRRRRKIKCGGRF